jgi:serine O-acetyltransferase
MIKSYADLKEYLAADKYALGIKRSYPRLFGDEIWKYERALRFHEFYENIGKKYDIRKFYWAYRHRLLSMKLGFQIPCNVFGKGLRINHFGLIVVNPNARIGDWCDIHQGVNIGENTDKKTPVLGNDCWIGPGAKIFGGISIGNNVMIGANAVVTQNFPDNSVVMGIPAEIKKYSGNIYAKELDYKTQKGNNL